MLKEDLFAQNRFSWTFSLRFANIKLVWTDILGNLPIQFQTHHSQTFCKLVSNTFSKDLDSFWRTFSKRSKNVSTSFALTSRISKCNAFQVLGPQKSFLPKRFHKRFCTFCKHQMVCWDQMWDNIDVMNMVANKTFHLIYSRTYQVSSK